LLLDVPVSSVLFIPSPAASDFTASLAIFLASTSLVSVALASNGASLAFASNGWFRKHIRDQRDRTQDPDCKERPSRRFPLIVIKPIRKQQTDADAKRNPSSDEQHDLGDGETSLRQGHMHLESHEYSRKRTGPKLRSFYAGRAPLAHSRKLANALRT